MLTSKERAALRARANQIEAIGQIGKDGITDNVIVQIDTALEARELIKFSVLETSPVTAREAADILSEETRSDCVQVIGNRFILYRKSKKKEK